MDDQISDKAGRTPQVRPPQVRPARESKTKDRYRMDDHKLMWHLDRVQAWQAGERIAPLHIDMGISTGCNMACSYCYGVLQNREGYGTEFKGKFNMPREAIERTFSDAKEIGVRSIAIIGEGENTLNPALYDVVDHGRQIDLDLSLATNAIRIDHERVESLLRGLTWLRVNISAATADSFQHIHKSSHFERVLGNIEAIVKAKHRLGSDCTIGMQMVVTKENYDDIVPLAVIGRDLGVDYFVVKQCSDTYDGLLDAPLQEYAGITPVLKEAEAMTTDDFTYAFRAGIGMIDANCEDCAGIGLMGREDLLSTGPVGRYPPNPLGLFDMTGNAAEWVQDCFHASYEGAPGDGTPWLSGDCDQRLTRGGTWFSLWSELAPFREGREVEYRGNGVGFRVFRELN